jgi:hypothetical protein
MAVVVAALQPNENLSDDSIASTEGRRARIGCGSDAGRDRRKSVLKN